VIEVSSAGVAIDCTFQSLAHDSPLSPLDSPSGDTPITTRMAGGDALLRNSVVVEWRSITSSRRRTLRNEPSAALSGPSPCLRQALKEAFGQAIDPFLDCPIQQGGRIEKWVVRPWCQSSQAIFLEIKTSARSRSLLAPTERNGGLRGSARMRPRRESSSQTIDV